MSPLPRGANVAFSRENPGLTEVEVAVDWGTVDPAFDAVLSMAAILLRADGRAASADDLVYFNQLQAPADAAQWAPVEHGERIRVGLTQVPDEIERIAFLLYVDALPASVPRQLGGLQSCVVTLSAAAYGSTLVTSENLAPAFGQETASVVAELYRRRGEWKFRVVAQGYAAGLGGALQDMGIPR